MLQLAATAERPRVQLTSTEDGGTTPFYQEIVGLDSTGGATAAFSVYALLHVHTRTTLSLLWETDIAVSDLYAPAGLGCTLQLEPLP